MKRIGPSEIAHKNMRFVIIDRPTRGNVQEYVEHLKKHDTSMVVRVCEPTYDDGVFEKEGIIVHEMQFDDGAAPPDKVISDWLQLVKRRFNTNPKSAVAVHCVAGLGRAPVLVAVALIEGGMRYEDAVEFIRKHRRGAINAKQLQFLEGYKPQKKPGCVIQWTYGSLYDTPSVVGCVVYC